MALKRPIERNEEIDLLPSKKAKMLTAVQECLKLKPIVKLKKLVNVDKMELNKNGPKDVTNKIHKACVKRNIDKVVKLINKGVTINVDKLNQKKTLFQAIKSQNLIIVQEVLKIRVDVNIQDEKDSTPLHLAAELGDPMIVEELLKNGADPNSKYDKLGDTPLHRAINLDQMKVVEKLLDFGVNVDLQSNTLKSPLHFAVEGSNLTIVKKLLKHKAFVDSQDVRKSTPLHVCAFVGNIKIAKELLKYGAKINRLNENGNSALYIAIHKKMFEMAEFLLEYGAIYVGKRYENYVSDISRILHDASYEGHFQVCKIVLENGASVDGNTDQMSPLHFAAEDEYLDILELLIKHGANVNYRDEDNITPFNGAVRYNHAEVVQRFFELGTNLDLNIRNDYGNTAFEDAVDSKKTFGRVGKLMIFQEHIKYH